MNGISVFFNIIDLNHNLGIADWYDNWLIEVAAGDSLGISLCLKNNDFEAYLRNHLVGAVPLTESVQPEQKSNTCYGNEPILSLLVNEFCENGFFF